RRSASGDYCREEDPEGTGRGATSAEDAGGSRPARLRVPGLQDQARETATAASEQDPHPGSIGWALCVSEREVDPPLHGSGASANQAAHPASHSGVDSEVKSADPGLGRVLQESSHPKTLQSARQLDCAAVTVAPIQTLAEYRLATASQNQAVRRVW